MSYGRVLLVEDDEDQARVIRSILSNEGFTVEWVNDGNSGLNKAKAGSWNLILLDIMLPKIWGTDILQEIRKENIDTPVIFLTARGDKKVEAFNLNTDGFILKTDITKPGDHSLVAEVKSKIKRYNDLKYRSLRQFGDLEIDLKQRTVKKYEVIIRDLKPAHFEILVCLTEYPGMTYEYDLILNQTGIQSTDALMSHISTLRRLIEDNPSRPQYILNVKGTGYTFKKN